MKKLRQLYSAAVLTLVLAISVFAGQMQTGRTLTARTSSSESTASISLTEIALDIMQSLAFLF